MREGGKGVFEHSGGHNQCSRLRSSMSYQSMLVARRGGQEVIGTTPLAI